LITFATPRTSLPQSRWRSGGRAHLVGIGGAGMRSLADVLTAANWKVTGSDENLTPADAIRWKARRGHIADRVTVDVDAVVHSPAIDDANPELVRARSLGIPVLSYPAMLGRLMRESFGIAIAGTHGKSTTTAMTAEILRTDGFDPTVIVGAEPLDQTSGGRFGRGDLVVAEACEYRDSFLHLRPKIASILNIEPDHFDYFHSAEQLDETFARFASQVASDGLLLVSDSCTRTQHVVRNASCRCETFGLSNTANWQARNLANCGGNYAFEIWNKRVRLGQIALRVPGRHNVTNALAAAAMAWHAGAAAAGICRGLSQFRGLRRRLETLGESGGVALVDDFAHHPTEVAASLAAVKLKYPGRRVWCIFQPHQASRTRALLDELAGSLHNAGKIFVADIYRAREPAACEGDVTAADLARRMRARGQSVAELHDPQAIREFIADRVRPGDVVLTMGAGNIGKIAHDLGKWLREHGANG